MSNKKIITGIEISRQKSKAKTILENIVIPRAELFELRKKSGKLSSELIKVLKTNA